ncbi:hypothetical protein CR513_08073, partial [Mucuna pruriens]
MKHPTEDHSLFGIDLIDKLVEEYLQLYNISEHSENFAGSTDLINGLGSITKEADYEEVHDLPNSEENNNNIANLDFEAGLFEVLDQVCSLENPECTNKVEVKSDPKSSNNNSPSPPPPKELKPLPNNRKYAYLDTEQRHPIIIANNLLQKQEDKLLNVLRQHKKWVSPMQVVPKKSGMNVMKNQQDELVAMRIQNSSRVCIDYRRLNQETHKDHFPLPFIDQVLEKLSGKSHYCFLDGFFGYMQIHIAPEINTRPPSLAHLVPLHTLACSLAYAML